MDFIDFIQPTSVLQRSDNIINTEHLFSSVSLHNVLAPKSYCAVKGKGYLVLDFGKEYFGGIRISFGNNSFKENKPFLRIRFGESLMEACSELGYKGSTNDHSTRDMTVFMSPHSDMTWGSTGFRFVRLDFLEEADYEIEYIVLAFKHEEEPELKFKSSNPRLDAIIEAAKRTLWLNKQDGVFFEGAKRDQHIWAGDLYPEITAAIYSFSSFKNIENTFDFLIQNYPLSTWYNDIISYNAWLILTLLRYFELTGNVKPSYLKCVHDNLTMFENLIEHDFHLEGVEEWGQRFFDWSTIDQPSAAYGIRYLFTYTLKKIASSPVVEEADRDLANRLYDRLSKTKPVLTDSKAVNSMALLLEPVDPTPFLDQIRSNGCQGYTVFLTAMILEALAQNNDLEFAYSSMLDYFGGMLQIGGTTLFEEFDLSEIENSCKLDEIPGPHQKDYHGDHGKHCYPGYRKSLCHGWACGVIPFVIEHIVGLKIENGNEISLSPHLLDLEFVEADIPTCHGPIHVSLKRKNGTTLSHIEIPESMKLKGGNA